MGLFKWSLTPTEPESPARWRKVAFCGMLWVGSGLSVMFIFTSPMFEALLLFLVFGILAQVWAQEIQDNI